VKFAKAPPCSTCSLGPRAPHNLLVRGCTVYPIITGSWHSHQSCSALHSMRCKLHCCARTWEVRSLMCFPPGSGFRQGAAAAVGAARGAGSSAAGRGPPWSGRRRQAEGPSGRRPPRCAAHGAARCGALFQSISSCQDEIALPADTRHTCACVCGRQFATEYSAAASSSRCFTEDLR
jgi:hypothetical protein